MPMGKTMLSVVTVQYGDAIASGSVQLRFLSSAEHAHEIPGQKCSQTMCRPMVLQL